MLRVKGRNVRVTHRADRVVHLDVEHQLIRDFMGELLNKLLWHRLIRSLMAYHDFRLAGRS